MIQRKQAICRPYNNCKMTQSKVYEGSRGGTEKLRKLKILEAESRSQSARSRCREQKNEDINTCRTRSMSPAPFHQPLNADLPLKKFYNIYSKIVVQLEMVKKLADNKCYETDNFLDLRRQLQRADEFAIRFSRNNLYEVKRILNEIKKLIIPYPFEDLSQNECKILGKKIILGYQAASQSLQIYINYVKNPSNLEVPEKITELIMLIAELFLCCEHLSVPSDEVYIQNDAVKICNELITTLKAKPPLGEYFDNKQQILTGRKPRNLGGSDDVNKIKNLSMYKAKSTKAMLDVTPKKKLGVPCLLGSKGRKIKQDERKARITHEIYTQKLNPRQGKGLANKIVKFEAFNMRHRNKWDSAADKKLTPKKPKIFTPREVKSQDDDIETVVQTIEDDDLPSARFDGNLEECNEVGQCNLNKSNFRDLLLNAIKELQSCSEKAEKTTLKKLLNSIQSCNNSRSHPPYPPRVKLYHFKFNDLKEEEKESETEGDERDRVGSNEEKSKTSSSRVDLNALYAEYKDKDGAQFTERRLKMIFKPIMQKKSLDTDLDVKAKGNLQLRLNDEFIENIKKYKKSFSDFMKNNIMYKKTSGTRPWELVEQVSDQIILDVIKEITSDFQNDAILKKLYFNELLEVFN